MFDSFFEPLCDSKSCLEDIPEFICQRNDIGSSQFSFVVLEAIKILLWNKRKELDIFFPRQSFELQNFLVNKHSQVNLGDLRHIALAATKNLIPSGAAPRHSWRGVWGYFTDRYWNRPKLTDLNLEINQSINRTNERSIVNWNNNATKFFKSDEKCIAILMRVFTIHYLHKHPGGKMFFVFVFLHLIVARRGCELNSSHYLLFRDDLMLTSGCIIANLAIMEQN